MSQKRLHQFLVLACGILAAGLISACGSSSKSSSTSSSTSAAATTGAATTSAASTSSGASGSAATAAEEQTPKSIGISTPLKSKPPTGKTIYFLRCSQPVCAGYLQGLTPAAKALGWTLKSVTYQPTPEAENAAMTQAVQAHADGIISTGLPAAVIQTSLKAAAAAKIPVVDAEDLNPVKAPIIANMANGAGNNFGPLAAANFIASDSKCQGDTAVYNIETYPILDYTTARLIPELKKLCPSMTVTQVNVQATDVGTKIPADVTSTVQRNPKIKYVAFAFGDMALGVPAALKAAGESATVVGYGAAGPTNVENVAHGVEGAETASGVPYDGWRAMDAFARDFEGMSTAIDTTAPNPFELFVKSNAKAVTGWNNMAEPLNMAQSFEKLWHVG